MSFDVGAEAYDCYMGRYSVPLASRFAGLVDAGPDQRVLDVGCGPGALTAVLVQRLGAQSVAAVDPAASFVSAVRARLPDVDVRTATAEKLPYPDNAFDLALAQLVVHFMADPEAGIREMARVTRPGGIVAACVWDHAGGLGPLATFWRAVHDLDPAAQDESNLPGVRDGDLVELFERAGLNPARQTTITVSASFSDVNAWWQPFTVGVGPPAPTSHPSNRTTENVSESAARNCFPPGASTSKRRPGRQRHACSRRRPSTLRTHPSREHHKFVAIPEGRNRFVLQP